MPGNCGKEGKKLQKFEYLKNKKSFVDEIKNIFHRAIILWKNKNLIKNSAQALRIIKKNQYALCEILTVKNEVLAWIIWGFFSGNSGTFKHTFL